MRGYRDFATGPQTIMPRRFGQDFDSPQDDGPSRSQLKRAAQAQQALGEAFCALPTAAITAAGIDEWLLEAVLEYRRLKSFEARRRQMQRIGKLLRDGDTAPVRSAVDRHLQGKSDDPRTQHQAELWRDRLLADDEALTEWTQHHPQCNSPAFRGLLRQARREMAHVAETGSKTGRAQRRAYRALFQQIRDALA